MVPCKWFAKFLPSSTHRYYFHWCLSVYENVHHHHFRLLLKCWRLGFYIQIISRKSLSTKFKGQDPKKQTCHISRALNFKVPQQLLVKLHNFFLDKIVLQCIASTRSYFYRTRNLLKLRLYVKSHVENPVVHPEFQRTDGALSMQI